MNRIYIYILQKMGKIIECKTIIGLYVIPKLSHYKHINIWIGTDCRQPNMWVRTSSQRPLSGIEPAKGKYRSLHQTDEDCFGDCTTVLFEN